MKIQSKDDFLLRAVKLTLRDPMWVDMCCYVLFKTHTVPRGNSDVNMNCG
jgi:hypothetical protein